eukprot:3736815-Rhodomonas_salina.1
MLRLNSIALRAVLRRSSSSTTGKATRNLAGGVPSAGVKMGQGGGKRFLVAASKPSSSNHQVRHEAQLRARFCCVVKVALSADRNGCEHRVYSGWGGQWAAHVGVAVFGAIAFGSVAQSRSKSEQKDIDNVVITAEKLYEQGKHKEISVSFRGMFWVLCTELVCVLDPNFLTRTNIPRAGLPGQSAGVRVHGGLGGALEARACILRRGRKNCTLWLLHPQGCLASGSVCFEGAVLTGSPGYGVNASALMPCCGAAAQAWKCREESI